MNRFIITWEGWFPAASITINPNPTDRNLTRCYGETPVEAESKEAAATLWRSIFPDSRIVQIS